MPPIAGIVSWFKSVGRDTYAQSAPVPQPVEVTARDDDCDPVCHPATSRGLSVVFVDDDLVDQPDVDPLASTDKIKLSTDQVASDELWRLLPQVYRDILLERARQDVRFGVANHDLMLWMTILGEEFGELCQAVMHTRYGGSKAGQLRAEAIQVAAVAVSIVQALDRDEWKWGSHVPS